MQCCFAHSYAKLSIFGHFCLQGGDRFTANSPAHTALMLPADFFLNDNNCWNEGIEATKAALKKSITLKKLFNGKDNLSTKQVLRALENAENLKKLRLERRAMSYFDTRWVANSLEQTTSLKGLHLHGNFIGPEGVAAIAAALAEDTSLQKLDLVENDDGPEGGAAMAAVLKKNVPTEVGSFSNPNWQSGWCGRRSSPGRDHPPPGAGSF